MARQERVWGQNRGKSEHDLVPNTVKSEPLPKSVSQATTNPSTAKDFDKNQKTYNPDLSDET